MQLNYKDIILRPNMSVCASRSEADTSASLGNWVFKVPVVCSNMPAVLTPDIVKQFDSNGWFYVWHRMGGPDDVNLFTKYANEELNVTSISVGLTKEWIKCIEDLAADKLHVDFITVDVAHSHNDNIIPIVDTIHAKFPNAFLTVGNGCTKEWIEYLESFGVHCAKTGVGVSKACQTNQFTGFGSTTVSSIRECSQARKDIKIMSDGGITCNSEGVPFIGEVTKSLVIGADWVMSGALFKHCSDNPAVVNGYYGNASEHAKGHNKHVEGRKVTVQSNGFTMKEMMDKIEHSLRSSISYSGGKNIQQMKELTTWDIVK